MNLFDALDAAPPWVALLLAVGFYVGALAVGYVAGQWWADRGR